MSLKRAEVGWFVEHLSSTKSAQQSVIRIKAIIVVNSATPKAAAKHDLLLKTGLWPPLQVLTLSIVKINRC